MLDQKGPDRMRLFCGSIGGQHIVEIPKHTLPHNHNILVVMLGRPSLLIL